MAIENVLWGYMRIVGELKKLGCRTYPPKKASIVLTSLLKSPVRFDILGRDYGTIVELESHLMV
ncbi:MAG: hypothetical protein ACYTDV_01580 [Planctomycetota bacterium]